MRREDETLSLSCCSSHGSLLGVLYPGKHIAFQIASHDSSAKCRGFNQLAANHIFLEGLKSENADRSVPMSTSDAFAPTYFLFGDVSVSGLEDFDHECVK